MQLRRQALTEWTLLTIVLVTLAGLSAWEGWLWRADQLLYDTALSLDSRPAPDDVVIVAIDDRSLAAIGRWPWRRAVHATLIEKLTQAGAAAIGMDVIFSEPDVDDPGGDRALAEAIQRNGSVVLPVVQRALAPGVIAEGLPIEQLARVAAGLGHVEIQLDPDGIARSVYLWGGAGGARFPHFALAILKVSRRGAPNSLLRDSPREGNSAMTWRREGWLHPQFAGPPGTYQTLSYVDVLSGAVAGDRLRGKLVLIGATAAGLGDAYPTPTSRAGRVMHGIEVHANVLDALRSNTSVTRASADEVTAITTATVLALMVALLFLSARDGLLLSTALGIATLVGTIVLLRHGHYWLPPSSILLGAILAYPLWSWRRLDKAQRFLDAELQALLAAEPGPVPDVAIKSSLDPLEKRIAMLRAATVRLDAIRKSREETMRFISQDLRSSLASIVALAEDADERGGTDGCSRLQQAGYHARRVLDLADNFFRLARAEALDQRQFEDVDLSSLVDEVAEEVHSLAQAKQIRILVRDESAREALIRGHRALLARALVSLLDNAIKFSPVGSRIHVTLRDDGKWRQVEVADEGYGIAPADIDALFTLRDRVADTEPAGVGLGLVVVKTVLERHGGMIDVQSTLGTGSTFTIRLPLAA